MVIWATAPTDVTAPPKTWLTGLLVCWLDGSPGHVTQTPFKWRNESWEASVVVSRAAETPTYVTGTVRLAPEVLATWQQQLLNPRREAAMQLREVMHSRGWHRDLGIVTFRPTLR